MPEPAALGPRRLWRAVIRPLVSEGAGDIVCDCGDAAVAEGLLATTDALVHAVRGEALDELAQVYADRLALHADAEAAWRTATGCRLAVIDVDRAASGHVQALSALAGGEEAAPPVLVQGLAGRGAGDPALADFTTRGWAVVELPGFDQIRLVLPGGRGALDSAALDKVLKRLRSGPGAIEAEATKVEELTNRVRDLEHAAAEAEAARELAERRRVASEDIVSALRLFNDSARSDLERARRETEHQRRLVDTAQSEAAAARARAARLARAQQAVREDLVRLEASRAWRIGHWLSRLARILTFRRPGRTNAVSKAIERIDAVTPPGDDHR